MKLRGRLIVTFVAVILIPVILLGTTVAGLGQYQFQMMESKYGSQDQTYREFQTAIYHLYAMPEVRRFILHLLLLTVLIMAITALFMVIWIYRSVVRPLRRLQIAARNIREGNLDFFLEPEADDEIGELCRDFEKMRTRLKSNAEEKVRADKESKELLSNISHDLKTPLTAIKGYVEGIMDGVADTPEKMDKYVRTIYNKTEEMDRLLNELTLYAKLDTNSIPYNFSKIQAKDYFEKCAKELSLDLEAKGATFFYEDGLKQNTIVIADEEQIRRVLNNIVGNSVKYAGLAPLRIQMRVKDAGDFLQVEIEDNGKGISKTDLPNVFHRFYRADTSRSSAVGGSGIGLSIVRKIIEEHGGKVWVQSSEGEGTVVYFVIRKNMEVTEDE